MGVELHMTNGPVVEHKGALAGLLTKLEPNDILFIDEIHRLNPVVEESLYPAMEDFRIDVMTGEGAFASSIQIHVQPVHARRRDDAHGPPHRRRSSRASATSSASISIRSRISRRSSSGARALLGVEIDAARVRRDRPPLARDAAHREPPASSRARLRARSLGTGKIDDAIVDDACERLDIDDAGFDEMDRRLLRIIIEDYDGGPVGVETLAAALGEPRDTIEDVYEPYLLQQGFLGRTPRGRVATRKAYEHLRYPTPTRRGQAEKLFDRVRLVRRRREQPASHNRLRRLCQR